jgi:ribosomal protein L29
MEPTNLTIEILKQIRDRIDGTNARLDDTRAELGELRAETRAGFATTNAEIRELRTETRAGFELHERALVRLIHEARGLGDRFDNFLHGPHHDDHADLRARVARLEAKVG